MDDENLNNLNSNDFFNFPQEKKYEIIFNSIKNSKICEPLKNMIEEDKFDFLLKKFVKSSVLSNYVPNYFDSKLANNFGLVEYISLVFMGFVADYINENKP